MSNLDPPRDPLETWAQWGNIRVGSRACDPNYVMCTLTHLQAYRLAMDLLWVLNRESGGSISPAEVIEALESSRSQELQTPEPPVLDKSGDLDDFYACSDPGGHVWHEGPPDRGDEGPIRCIHCGADGDA